MLRLQKKVPSDRELNRLHPGNYSSTVQSVEQPEGYADGCAVKITYELTDTSGNHFPYHEIF